MQQPNLSRLPIPAPDPAAGSFLAMLIAEVRRGGQDVVLDVPHAVEWLFGLPCPTDPDIVEHCDSTTLERVAREYRPAVAELLERTRGARCRLDTPSGALFLGAELIRFSGGQDVPRGESASWPESQPLEAA